MEACNVSPLYRDKNHCSGVFNIFRERRIDPLFHNVNLLAENIEIRTNKMLLAASSPYFHEMFTSLFQEREEKNVRINGISAEILTLIIDFLYTSEILITKENVQDLLAASNFLQFDSISNACIQFLKERILPTNCLGIQAIADSTNSLDLVNDIKTFIDENFTAVTESKEFLLLPLKEVCSLISRDELRVLTEEDVFRAVIVWIDHDITSRKQHFLLLLKNIRICYLTENYVQKIFLNHPLFRDNPESYAYAKAAADQFFPIVERPARLTAKCRQYLSQILLVTGGSLGSSVEYYCLKKKAWFTLADTPVLYSRASATVLYGKVHIVSGNGNNRVDIYDAATDRWIPSISMQSERSNSVVATLKNCIYAVGGFDNEGPSNTVEKFDPESKQWSTVAPMLSKRSSHGVGVINNVLYAVGGYQNGAILNLVESYNPATNTWTSVKSMNSKRQGVGVHVLNGMLYAVGGARERAEVVKSAEVFDPKTGNWTMIKDMHNRRLGAAVVAANDLLYVVGGSDGRSSLTSVEVYDPKTMTWSVLPGCMNCGRYWHCAAIFDKYT